MAFRMFHTSFPLSGIAIEGTSTLIPQLSYSRCRFAVATFSTNTSTREQNETRSNGWRNDDHRHEATSWNTAEISPMFLLDMLISRRWSQHVNRVKSEMVGWRIHALGTLRARRNGERSTPDDGRLHTDRDSAASQCRANMKLRPAAAKNHSREVPTVQRSSVYSWTSE